jgi:hypothetical protein
MACATIRLVNAAALLRIGNTFLRIAGRLWDAFFETSPLLLLWCHASGRGLSAMTLLLSLAFGGVAVSILSLISLLQKRKRSSVRWRAERMEI